MQVLPCLLCGKTLEKRTDKNGKPYFVCDPCGIQMFIRRRHGIERLEKLLQASEKNLIPFRQHAHRLFEIQALLAEIDGTKKQINRLENELGFFFRDKDKLRTCNLLKTNLEKLFRELTVLAQKESA
jgi:DNA-directed RNA polymerase subunit RPC12/RpoP